MRMPNDFSDVQADNVKGLPKEPKSISWTQRPWLRIEPLLRVLLVILIILSSIVLASFVWQLVSAFSSLILLFFASWLLALLLSPVVGWLIKQGLPKLAAVALTYVVVLATIVGFIVLVLPGLIAQTDGLVNNLGSLTNDLSKTVNDLLKGWGVSIDLGQITMQLQSFGTELLKNALGVATGIANFLLQILLLFIISFSLLAGRSYTQAVRKALHTESKTEPSLWQRLPERYREQVEFIKLSFERNFGVFLGGQLLVSLIYGVGTWIVMWIAGFPYPVTTGCICGALMIIPFFGGPLSLLPPLIVAFSRNDSPIIVVLIILFAFQTVLLNVVLPKLVGSSSGIGPVTTLFVLLAGAQIGGIFGVLLAVPVAGVVKNLAVSLLTAYLGREESLAAPPVAVPLPTETKVEIDLTTLIGVENPPVKK